jgi:hypothetical protein
VIKELREKEKVGGCKDKKKETRMSKKGWQEADV